MTTPIVRTSSTLPKGDTSASLSLESLQSNITGPAGSAQFGATVAALPNGNIVVTDPLFDSGAADVGAVRLYNGATLALISSLTGSTANDQVGSGGVTVLSNGNFVVRSPNWDGAAVNTGAVTLGNATTGVGPTVTAGNSIVGDAANDLVGSGGVTALTNGNYVVSSPNWGATDLGAATWGNGAGGSVGPVSTGISLVGSTLNDFVSSGGVTALTNGNYVVSSPVSGASDLGAVTWGNGSVGTSGTVSAANSLTGTAPNDSVGLGGVSALTNGNYVVRSPNWDNGGGATDAGAATFAIGTAATVDTVSPVNSLVGTTTNDSVSGAGVTSLSDGDYVVRSPAWGANDVGAATFGSGTAGVFGPVSALNSLVGSTSNDLVSGGGVAALSSGNYVVGSPNWDNGAADIGAATFGIGTGVGTVGLVTAGNSYTGATAGDNVGSAVGISNGNYVLNSPNWGATNVGAVTFVDASVGTSGTVTAANSLAGSTANDNVGSSITALTNGNYVVRSPNWDGSAVNTGAVTWASGTTGITGAVSATNSLVGSTANDQIGIGGVIAVSNGNYTVRSPNWDNGATVNAGAVTYGAGNGGTVDTIVVDANSVLGTVANGTVAPAVPPATPLSLERLVVGRPSSNIVTIHNPTYTAVANGNWSSASTWDFGAFFQAHDVVIPTGRTVLLDANVPAGGTLTIDAGGTLSLSGDRSSGIPITNNGTINLTGGRLNMGANLLTLGCAGTFSGANVNGYVFGNVGVGTVRKDFCSTGAFSFAIGSGNGFAAVDVNVTALGAGPNSLTINSTGTVHPTLFPANSLKRYWTITETGDLTADLVFHYNDPLDIVGLEATYKLFRVVGSTPTLMPGSLNTTANTMSINGVSDFSDWAIGNAVPTADEAKVSGRVVLRSGRGVANALVTLTDQSGNERTVTSNRVGAFIFTDVTVGMTYVVSVASRRLRFEPQIIQVNGDVDGIILTGSR